MLRLQFGLLGLLFILGACAEERTYEKRDNSQESGGDGAFREIESNSDDALAAPVNVSGSYLFCRDDADAQEINCKVASSFESPKIDLAEYAPEWTWGVQNLDPENLAISSSELPESSEWHFSASFSSADDELLRRVLEKTQVSLALRPEENRLQYSSTLPGGFSNGFLPSDFRVFVGVLGISNSPFPASREVILPTNNSTYPDLDGCYQACYSNRPDNAVYQVAADIYVKGQVRVRGAYEGRICEASGYGEGAALQARMADICRTGITSCRSGDCFAGGDTGGWFGIGAPAPEAPDTEL